MTELQEGEILSPRDARLYARTSQRADLLAASVAPVPVIWPPTPISSPVASLNSSTAPAPDGSERSEILPVGVYLPRPTPVHRRPVEQFFDGVGGYQQVSALTRSVNDVLPNEQIDMLQFDQGQHVPGFRSMDLERLVDRRAARPPSTASRASAAGDLARFRCV